MQSTFGKDRKKIELSDQQEFKVAFEKMWVGKGLEEF